MRFPHAVMRSRVIRVGVIQGRQLWRQTLQFVEQLFKVVPVAGGVVQLAGQNPAIFLAQGLGDSVAVAVAFVPVIVSALAQ